MNPHIGTLVHLIAVQAVNEYRKGSGKTELIRIFLRLTPALRQRMLETARKICKRKS